MTCTCVSCIDCNGTGSCWYSISGDYLGNAHCDDLDDLRDCEECRGSGIIETCTECLDAEEAQDIINEINRVMVECQPQLGAYCLLESFK